MFARSLVALVVASAAVLAAPSIALADMPPDSCEGADVGDACTTQSLGDGTCQDVGGSLECVEGGATTAATSTAASTAAATTAAATTAASTGSGTTDGSGGGEEGSGGSAGGGEPEDDGCSVRAPRGKHTTHVGAAAVFALASAIALARRLRRR